MGLPIPDHSLGLARPWPGRYALLAKGDRAIGTGTLRYFGSKASVIDEVYQHISTVIPTGSLCDPFGGIGTVAARFKGAGYSVWSGDHLMFAYAYQLAHVGRASLPTFPLLRNRLGFTSSAATAEHLNGLSPVVGWITDEYSTSRTFFSRANASAIDSCLVAIEDWATRGWISALERLVLLSSLAESADRVANTAGTYYAYLKSLSSRAGKPFRFRFISPTRGPRAHVVLGNAGDLVARQAYDVVYLDPPYNSRRYAGYYHLPETLVRGTRPAVQGLAGIPDELRPHSDFNSPGRALSAFADLVALADCQLLAVHYAPDGLIPLAAIEDVLAARGAFRRFDLTAVGYTSISGPRTVKHVLYLSRNA